MAERALLEAIQNRFESGSLEFNETINLLCELVASLRLESKEKVESTAVDLISEYNRAVEDRKACTASCLSTVRNALSAHETYKYHNSSTMDSLNSVSKSPEWKTAITEVLFPSFPNP